MLNREERKLLNECLAALRAKVERQGGQVRELLQPSMGSLATKLRRFELVKGYLAVELEDAWKLRGADAVGGARMTLALARIVSQRDELRRGGMRYHVVQRVTYHECYVLGLVQLPEDCGHALIRPESFADKLLEWFNPQEIEFEGHPEFNKRYYVLSREPERLAKGFPERALEALAKRKGLHVEILGKTGLIKHPVPFAPRAFLETAECGLGMAGGR